MAKHRTARELRDPVYALWQKHKEEGSLPTSARFLFYELVAAGTVSKNVDGKAKPEQSTIAALTWLRKRGLIPWKDITDESRTVHD